MASLFITLGLLLPGVTTAAERGSQAGEEFSLDLLVGVYRLVGQLPDSNTTYSGRVTLARRGSNLEVTRVIAGKTTHGTAEIEHATADKIPVLKMRFSLYGKPHERTFLWRPDLDNHARLSGYVYRSPEQTKSPGLEALFVVPEE